MVLVLLIVSSGISIGIRIRSAISNSITDLPNSRFSTDFNNSLSSLERYNTSPGLSCGLDMAGLKLLENLVCHEACSVLRLLRVFILATSPILGLGCCAAAILTNKDKQFLFITFLRV